VIQINTNDIRKKCKNAIANTSVGAHLESVLDEIDIIRHEVLCVLSQLDHLAEVWGDEGVFRTCRDRLRNAVSMVKSKEGDQ
jgi:hypothetical protein